MLRNGNKVNLNISVLVSAHFRNNQLEQCLLALAPQLEKSDELIVGITEDDLLSQEVAWKLKKYFLCPVRQIVTRKNSVIEKLNLMADTTTTNWITTIDDDAIPPSDWVRKIKANLCMTELGAIGGRDIQPGNFPGTKRVGVVSKFGKVIGNHEKVSSIRDEVDFLKGVNMTIRKEAFPIISVMKGEGPEPHWEIFLCRKLSKRGLKIIFDSSLCVQHNPGVRTHLNRETNPTLAYIYSRNLFLAFGVNREYWKLIRIFFHQIIIGRSPAYGIATTLFKIKSLRFNSTILASSIRGAIKSFNIILNGRIS